MPLDFSLGCVNFRDAGEWVNLLAARPLLPTRRLLRGGKLDAVTDAADIGDPGTIFCLRKGADPPHLHFGADVFHFPISNDYEKYHTTDPVVRRWLRDVLRTLANEVERLPLLVHCTSGKDRTGVVVAALLTVAGVDRATVIDEYLLSDGEVRREWIETALDGVGDPEKTFRGIDLDRVRRLLASS